jgi:hypothetical protein
MGLRLKTFSPFWEFQNPKGQWLLCKAESSRRMIKCGVESMRTLSKLFTADDTSEAGATCVYLYVIE